MFRRIYLNLGVCLLLALIPLVFFGVKLLPDTSLLRQGITTQGVIVSKQPIGCGRKIGCIFSVRFTDQAGQAHTSTISQYNFAGFTASPGDSVTIVYLPNDPGTISPTDLVFASARGDLIVIILC